MKMMKTTTPIELDLLLSMSLTRDRVRIAVEDKKSSVQFLKLEIGAAEFTAALSGLAYRPCSGSVVGSHHLVKLGKQHECTSFRFAIDSVEDIGVAKSKALRLCPDGWEPDLHFADQTSFGQDDDGHWAQTIIRRWVAVEAAKEK